MALKIGELARRTGRSVHTLRYYESAGLIPNVERDAGGRRLYTERHVQWIDLLIRLRNTGMTIQQIRQYAQLVARGDETLEERRVLLGEHRDRLTRTIEEMTTCIDLIDVKRALYQEWIEAGGSPLDLATR